MIAPRQRREFKARLRNREQIFAGWTSIGHPTITSIFTRAGVDFIGIDIEHSTISLEQSENIIAACHANGVVCLPRVASHNAETIKRLLDAGADGIIVPMVSTSEQVERLISWCKYPPLGGRSYGVARGQGYGFDFDDYTSTWNDTSTLILQIESTEGVDNIDRLLAFDGVDGAMVGPYDLSGSLGIPGRLDAPEVLDAARKVIDACSGHGRACGTHIIEPDEAQIRQAFESGYTFAALASDVFVLWKWAARLRETVSRFKGT